MNYLKDWFGSLSIRWQILSLVLATLVILSVGVLYYVNLQASALLSQNLSTILKQSSNSVANEVGLNYQLEDWEALQERAESLVDRSDIPVAFVVFVDSEGNVQASAPQPEASYMLQEFSGDEVAEIKFQGHSTLGKLTPVQNKGDTLGQVGLALSKKLMQSQLQGIMIWSVGIILVLSSFGLALLYLGINRFIVSPFQKKAQAIAEGQFSSEYHDQIVLGGEIGEAFENMRLELIDIVRKIRNFASRVTDTSEEVLSASENLNESAETQNQQIEESSSAVTELSQSVQEVADRADRAQEVAESAQDQAREGGDAVAQAIEEMKEIQDSDNSTAEEVERLGESGDEIGKIVGVISQIAEQTSLLALNAAIEAARAGEQGKGFAVVADEVSRLADRVGDSADEIEELIEQIQEQTDISVESMEEGTRKVQSGVEVVDDAGSVLEDISTQMDELVREFTIVGDEEN